MGNVDNRTRTINNDYSFEEDTTGGTFALTGELIYCKTIDLGALPNATTKDVAHGIGGYTRIVALSGVARSGTINYPLNYAAPLASQSIGVYVLNSVSVRITTRINYSAYSGEVTLQYTKG